MRGPGREAPYGERMFHGPADVRPLLVSHVVSPKVVPLDRGRKGHAHVRRHLPGRWQASVSAAVARPVNAAPEGPRQSLGCPRLVRGCQRLTKRAVVCHAAGGKHPPTPLSVSLRSVVGRAVFHCALCAAASSPLANPRSIRPQASTARRSALRPAPAVLPPGRARNIIGPALLRQGPRRKRLSPLPAMGPPLDTRWCR